MVQNESETDRIVRVVLGTVSILIAYSTLEGLWFYVLGVLGLILVITGLTGFCAIYKLLGISTKKIIY
ncbi:MAG TPA: DUF2892 domain-containing protein [Candidatus Woesebacteria bacterium]|nr:DUF2892 domain-containing protein [Candidatus Woesebacteria bacterium]